MATMIVCGSVSLILLCLAVSSGWWRLFLASGDYEAAVRILCAVTGLLAGSIALRLHRIRLLHERKSEDIVPQPSMSWLSDLQKSVGAAERKHEFAAVQTFIELTVSASRHRSRVVETINFEGRDIIQRVSVEMTFPRQAKTETLYLPVLQPIKGELIDKFALSDSAGSRLTNLSYAETTLLAATGLHFLLLDAKNTTELDEEDKIRELALLSILARRGKGEPKLIAAQIDEALSLLGLQDESDRRDRLRSFLLSLSMAYPIVSVVPSDRIVANRVMLRYERAIIPRTRHKGWRGDIRLGLGIRPNQVAVPPDLALTSGSYHLLINCPADKYVLQQKLMCRHCQQLVTPEWRGSRPKTDFIGAPRRPQDNCCHYDNPPNDGVESTYRLRRRRGQSYVHLYMRGYAEAKSPMRNLQMLVQLKEVPPGSRGQAVVTAIATTVLIGLVGYLISHHKVVSSSGLPALALSLPVVVASWFGFTADSKTLTGSSLLARLSLILSGFLSVAAIVVYVAQVSTVPAPKHAMHGAKHVVNFAFAGVTSGVWLVLLIISTVNLIYISWRFAIKIRVYSSMLQRRDASDVEYSHG